MAVATRVAVVNVLGKTGAMPDWVSLDSTAPLGEVGGTNRTRQNRAAAKSGDITSNARDPYHP